MVWKKSVSRYLEFWARYEFTTDVSKRFHPCDRKLINEFREKEWLEEPETLEQFEEVENLTDKHRHFVMSLGPAPFVGNIESPAVVILAKNPGFGAMNVVDFVSHNGLRLFSPQRKGWANQNLFPLGKDASVLGYSGLRFWHDRLWKIAWHIHREDPSVSYADVVRKVGDKIAIVDLCPYHSKSGFEGKARSDIRRLPSVLESARLVWEGGLEGDGPDFYLLYGQSDWELALKAYRRHVTGNKALPKSELSRIGEFARKAKERFWSYEEQSYSRGVDKPKGKRFVPTKLKNSPGDPIGERLIKVLA